VPGTANQGHIAALRAAYAAHADAARAPAMQAYMKSTLPFHGIAAPLRRQLCAAVAKAHPMADVDELVATMAALWRTATHREERYAAEELAGGTADLRLLPVFEEMITSSAWWDCCDEISGNGLAQLLQAHPKEIKPVLRRWAVGADLWLRRAAMLCQRKLRAEFDAPLFYACILPSVGSGRFADEFFIRKGMGWALRERSYSAPDEVRAFCHEYAAQLSPLTKREALRVIDRQ
jgi:3-methyladenine DNA glycosylase AlkD